MNDRYILTNATFLTMDRNDSRHSAMAVENGRIHAIGSNDDMALFQAEGWPAIDLGGAAVLPGFTDTHQHLGLTGQVLNGITLREATTVADVVERVRERAQDIAEGEWVLGYTLDDFLLKENRMPLKEELDAACSDAPVMVVHSSWHFCSLNSHALALLNLPPGLDGMDIGSDGMPTGVVRDPGALSHVFPAVSAMTPTEVKLKSFHMACEAAMQQGITTLHCLEGGEFGPGDTRLATQHQDKLPLTTVIWNQVMDIPETLELGLKHIGGCICADGAMTARTAALLEPYCDNPGNCGTLNYSQQQMDSFIMEAHKNGLQVAIHCETDGAIEQVLSAMEKAIAAHPRDDHRHRIEHCEIPNLDQLERMAAAGVIASMQPSFLVYMTDWEEYDRCFGPHRMRWLHPYRTMIEHGVRMCGGSDCPITPHAPLFGVQAAVLHPTVEERLTVIEALRLFTSDAAYAGFEDDRRGTLEPGKVADLVILAHDPTCVSPETISSIDIRQTVVAGVPVFGQWPTSDA